LEHAHLPQYNGTGNVSEQRAFSAWTILFATVWAFDFLQKRKHRAAYILAQRCEASCGDGTGGECSARGATYKLTKAEAPFAPDKAVQLTRADY
jgi:hypothetical protein